MGLVVFIVFILFMIPIILVGIFVIKSIAKQSGKSKGFKESIKTLTVPEDTKRKVERKFAQYEPVDLGIVDIVKNLGLYKSASAYVHSTLSSKVTFLLYPTLTFKNMFNLKNALIKCYSQGRYHGVLDMKNYTQYSAIKLKEGLLECFHTDMILTVCMNGSTLGSFDYNTHKIFHSQDGEVGEFTSPPPLSFKSISIPGLGTYDFGHKLQITMNGHRAASVIPQASTEEKILKFAKAISSLDSVDINMFSNVHIENDWEAFMLLAIGIVEYIKIYYPVGR